MAKVNRADSLTRIITDHKQRIEKLERNFVSSGGSINIFAGYGLEQDGLELYVNTDEIATREYVDGLIEDIAGVAPGLRYEMNLTDTSESDPGSGKLKVNDTALHLTTELYVSETELDGGDVSATIASWDDSTSTHKGYVLVRNIEDTGSFLLAQLNSITDNGTWVTIEITSVSSAGSFSNGDLLSVQFYRTGDKGDKGDTGPTPDLSDLGISRGTSSVNVSGNSAVSSSINHGLGVTPTTIVATARNSNSAVCDIRTRTSSSFTVGVKHRDAGSNINSVVQFDWIAIA